jgi:molybdenum-dependent DNA-binding transcriptional regulator ModE
MLRQFRERFVGAMQGADEWIAGEAAKRAAVAQEVGVERNRQAVLNGRADELVKRMANERLLTDEQMKSFSQRLDNPAKRAALADHYAPRMRRGPGEMTQQGVLESVNRGIAENAVVRRGVLPAAVAGGGIMGGALVTEGAQQLMALMGFMQQGAQQQERAEQSPLA